MKTTLKTQSTERERKIEENNRNHQRKGAWSKKYYQTKKRWPPNNHNWPPEQN